MNLVKLNACVKILIFLGQGFITFIRFSRSSLMLKNVNSLGVRVGLCISSPVVTLDKFL